MISAHDATAAGGRRARSSSETLSLLTATLDSTADGILVVDNAGTITGFNRRFSEIWQHRRQNFVAVGDDSTKLAFVLDQLLNPQSFLARRRELVQKPENESFDTLEFKDGRALELTSRPQTVDDTIVGRVWSFRDVTDRIRLEDELEYRAFHDSLTGLANKALFQDRLEHALARIEPDGVPPGRALHRPRRLQDGERQPGARRGGPAAQAGGDGSLRAACGRSTRRPVSAATSSPSSLRTCRRRRTSRSWPGASSNRSAWPSRSGPEASASAGQHRHRLRRAGHHQRAAAAQCGHRHVQGEGERQGPLRGLPPGDARRRAGPHRAGA